LTIKSIFSYSSFKQPDQSPFVMTKNRTWHQCHQQWANDITSFLNNVPYGYRVYQLFLRRSFQITCNRPLKSEHPNLADIWNNKQQYCQVQFINHPSSASSQGLQTGDLIVLFDMVPGGKGPIHLITKTELEAMEQTVNTPIRFGALRKTETAAGLSLPKDPLIYRPAPTMAPGGNCGIPGAFQVTSIPPPLLQCSKSTNVPAAAPTNDPVKQHSRQQQKRLPFNHYDYLPSEATETSDSGEEMDEHGFQVGLFHCARRRKKKKSKTQRRVEAAKQRPVNAAATSPAAAPKRSAMIVTMPWTTTWGPCQTTPGSNSSNSPNNAITWGKQGEKQCPCGIQLFPAKWTTLSEEKTKKEETRGMQRFLEKNPNIRNMVLCMFPGGRVRRSGSVEGWKSLHINVPGSSMGVPCFPIELSQACNVHARTLCVGNKYLRMTLAKKPVRDFNKSEPPFEHSAYERLLGGYEMHSPKRFYEIDMSYDYDPNHPAPDIVKIHHVWHQSKCAHPREKRPQDENNHFTHHTHHLDLFVPSLMESQIPYLPPSMRQVNAFVVTQQETGQKSFHVTANTHLKQTNMKKNE
jgi:hypothetical protein